MSKENFSEEARRIVPRDMGVEFFNFVGHFFETIHSKDYDFFVSNDKKVE